MKKLMLGLGLVALLAGCASHQDNNGMGGTSDSMKTDSYNSGSSDSSSDQFHNNASNGTGSSTATNNNSGGQTAPQ